ncbi:MAG: hypothetical protein L6R36_000743 [Xanthoria steineri]|nr:MAG: hypothetical protein L6R36_000743 [Xanthoria steineri]
MPRSEFFDRYPHFQQDPSAPINEEFKRLASIEGWNKKSIEWRIHRRECLEAEFEVHLGGIDLSRDLAVWHGLCQELGVSVAQLTSIKKCKTALRRVHVNLMDLIDARRAQQMPRLFPSEAKLAKYTRDHARYFPLAKAKEDSLKKILLKNIVSPRRR